LAIEKDKLRNHEEPSPPFEPQTVLHDFRLAMISRQLDEVEKKWQIQGRAKFCILGAGQEIAQVCAARPLQPGDWMRSYYRGLAESLAAGICTPRQVLAQVLGDPHGAYNDPASGGRMMGRHFGSRLLDQEGSLRDLRRGINHASDVSCTGSQMGPALGLAAASKVFSSNDELRRRHPKLSQDGREVTHVSIGDASMAEGISLEAVNQAVVQHLPLIISVFDNGYGISVPGEKQVAHGSITKALRGFEYDPQSQSGLATFGPLKDWQYSSLRSGYEQAYEWVRKTRGPALVHVQVTQPAGHSSSGDHRRYKSNERLRWEAERDGITHLRNWILARGIAGATELEEIERHVHELVAAEAEIAWCEYYQPLIDLGLEAYSLWESSGGPVLGASLAATASDLRADATLDAQAYVSRGRVLRLARSLLQALRGTSRYSEFAPKVRAFCQRVAQDGKQIYASSVFAPPHRSATRAETVAPTYDSRESDSGAHIIAAGLASMMEEDLRIVVFGEDVGGLGGVTTCTLGLQTGMAQIEPEIWRKSPALRRYVNKTGYGAHRVWDTGISEATIVGAACGLAVRGLRPVAEIQYHDYVNYGAQQLEDEIASLRYRTRGGQEAPCLVRCHGHRLLGMWHSGSPMAMMLRMPGLFVIAPRDAVQAVALYRAALLRGHDPVFSVEPLLGLYARTSVPSNLGQIQVPLGSSEILREGSMVTIVTYGHCCALAIQAAGELQAGYSIEAEVIDLQSLNPLDLNDLAGASVRKTGNVLFLDEDYENGAMSMIAKTILFDRRDPEGRPMTWFVEAARVLTAPAHKPAYGTDGGFFSKPQVEDIVDAVCSMLDELDGGSRRLFR